MMETSENKELAESQSTSDRLLDAAERLFSARGFESTSVRDITAAAACNNVAAVNYYFGSKEKLYEAVMLRLLRDLREWRMKRIRRDLGGFGEQCSLEEFLAVFVRLFLDELGDEERRQRLTALIDQEFRTARLSPVTFNNELVKPVREITTAHLSVLEPGLDPQTIDLCIEFLMGHLVHARRLRDDIRNRNARPESNGDKHQAGNDAEFDEDLFVAKIVTYAAGGIRACAAD